jgi:hypothetical protein
LLGDVRGRQESEWVWFCDLILFDFLTKTKRFVFCVFAVSCFSFDFGFWFLEREREREENRKREGKEVEWQSGLWLAGWHAKMKERNSHFYLFYFLIKSLFASFCCTQDW